MKLRISKYIFLVMLAGGSLSGQGLFVDFEDVDLAGAGVEAYAGPFGGVYNAGSDGAGGFSSEGIHFGNSYTDWGGGYFSWEGWSYSTTTDTTTAGPGNQFSAFTGEALSGNVYALAYAPTTISLPLGWRAPQSLWVTNTTYAALSMQEGDAFASKFEAGDYFKLTLTGLDPEGVEQGSVEVYLADFRSGLETGTILDYWLEVDLTPLGPEIAEIGFTLESTDNGAFGMNTPSFIAIDDFEVEATPVPEPGKYAVWVGLLGLGLVLGRRSNMLSRHVK